MKPEINTDTAETVKTGGDQAVVQKRLVRPSSEWEKETGVVVMDYGGWRDKSYKEAITKDEFLGRCCDSRCQWPREILDALIHGTNREHSDS